MRSRSNVTSRSLGPISTKVTGNDEGTCDGESGPSITAETVQYYASSNNKAHKLFCELIMPIVVDSVYSHLPERTSFIFTEEDILASTLSRINKKCPQLYSDKQKFMQTVETIVFGGGMFIN